MKHSIITLTIVALTIFTVSSEIIYKQFGEYSRYLSPGKVSSYIAGRNVPAYLIGAFSSIGSVTTESFENYTCNSDFITLAERSVMMSATEKCKHDVKFNGLIDVQPLNYLLN